VRGADHPLPSKCWGHERVGLYLYSPSGPQWPVIGWTFTFFPLSVQKSTSLNQPVQNYFGSLLSQCFPVLRAPTPCLHHFQSVVELTRTPKWRLETETHPETKQPNSFRDSCNGHVMSFMTLHFKFQWLHQQYNSQKYDDVYFICFSLVGINYTHVNHFTN
jgi:hypothetical protein